MLAIDLYQALNNDGVQLWVEGEKLRFAPKEKITPFLLAELKAHKSELLLLLVVNDPHPKVEIQPIERKIPFNLDNYRHLVTCNQCEHLSLTGSCSRLGKRVNPQAMRECDSFTLLKKERPLLEAVKPYTQDELNRLLNQAAKPLYHHLIDCEQCSLEDARYCVEGFGLGNTFDCLLMVSADAANKRYLLMNQVIKARVSGNYQRW